MHRVHTQKKKIEFFASRDVAFITSQTIRSGFPAPQSHKQRPLNCPRGQSASAVCVLVTLAMGKTVGEDGERMKFVSNSSELMRLMYPKCKCWRERRYTLAREENSDGGTCCQDVHSPLHKKKLSQVLRSVYAP